MTRIDIEDDKRRGAHANVELRMLPPPFPDLYLVDGCVFEAIGCEGSKWMFSRVVPAVPVSATACWRFPPSHWKVQREDGQPSRAEVESGIEQGCCAALARWAGAHDASSRVCCAAA